MNIEQPTSYCNHRLGLLSAGKKDDIPLRRVDIVILQEVAGVLGEVNIAEYALYFIPLADDLLSMELDDAFSDLYLVRNLLIHPTWH